VVLELTVKDNIHVPMCVNNSPDARVRLAKVQPLAA
jgi:hypothetical protein